MSDKSYSFSVSDAQKWGSADIASILHKIRFWLDKNKANNTHIHDGRVWTYNSAEAFSKLFPWLSSSQIKRLLKKLHDGGLLLKGNHSEDKLKKANWYSLDEPEYIVGAPVKTPKNAPEPPAEKSKGQHGGFRKGAGEATGQRSQQHLKPILPIITAGIEAGKTLQAISGELNDRGFKTQTGRPFQRNHVHKIINRKQLRNK